MKPWSKLIGYMISEIASPREDFKRPPDDLIIRVLRSAYELAVYEQSLKKNKLFYPSQYGYGSAPFQPEDDHINPEITKVKVNGKPVFYEQGEGEVSFDPPACGFKNGVEIEYRYSVLTDNCNAPDEVFVEPLRSLVINKALEDLLSDSHMDWYNPNAAQYHKTKYDNLVMTTRKRKRLTRSGNIEKRAGDIWWDI